MLPGLVYTTGHFRNGILLAPLTAALVADAMLDGKIDPLMTITRRNASVISELTIGDRRYSVHVEQRAGGWVAHAERPENGARVSGDWTSGSRDDVVSRLTRWLTWQVEHELALEALQEAERTGMIGRSPARRSAAWKARAPACSRNNWKPSMRLESALTTFRASQPMDHEERP